MSAASGRGYEGIYGVTVTPFTEDGRAVDEERLSALVEDIVSGGVAHVIPCGNTGEFFALRSSERRRLVEITVQVVAGRAGVVAGVGGSMIDARRQAEHAAKAGANAVMIHHPPHPFVSSDGYLTYIAGIVETGLPVLPYVRQPVLDSDGIRRLAATPGVAGVKFAYNDLQSLASAVQDTSDTGIAWICGTAERWFPLFWQAGAVGFTSGLVNVTVNPSSALLEALGSGRSARAMRIWNVIRPFEELRAVRGDAYNVAVIKHALRELGKPVGPVRAPASEVDAEMRGAIRRLLPALMSLGDHDEGAL